MKKITLITLSLFFFVSAAAAQKTEAAKTGPATITVEATDGKAVNVTASDIAKLSRKEVTGKDHDGKESKYSGVELREVLQLAGVKFGKDLRGKGIAQYLLIEAADGYKAVYSLTELDPDFTDKVVILADTQDGKALSDNDGKFQVIATGEKKHARWVRQVTALKVRFGN